jgi:integration host factor subunit alpha
MGLATFTLVNAVFCPESGIQRYLKKILHPFDIDGFMPLNYLRGLESLGGKKMGKRTVTRADLSEAVYQEVGLSRNESTELVESILSQISSSLVAGDNVKISSFGSFLVRHKGGRIGRNPKTGEEVPIEPRRVLVFRPSQVMKERIASSLKGQA